MTNLLLLFSTDRRLLESRGSLIIRQLCLSLDPERIYCTIADILETDEVRKGGDEVTGADLYLVHRTWNSLVSWYKI